MPKTRKDLVQCPDCGRLTDPANMIETNAAPACVRCVESAITTDDQEPLSVEDSLTKIRELLGEILYESRLARIDHLHAAGEISADDRVRMSQEIARDRAAE